MKKTTGKYAMRFIFILAIAAFLVLIGFRLFDKLDELGIADFDEAYHAVNAYEMFKDNRWIVNTYGGEVDYFNSKPPMGLWPSLILFHIFGTSMYLFKLPGAISGALVCLILSIFLFLLQKNRYKNEYGLSGNVPYITVMLFTAAFLAMDMLFDYHLFRTGNFDALYTLFLMLGMVCIHLSRKDARFLIPFGIFTSCAFQTKSFNAVIAILAAICCYPFLEKGKRLKYTFGSIIAAVIAVLPWAVKRFMFDGTRFFHAMLFTEAEDKVRGLTLEFIRLVSGELVFQILFAVILVNGAVYFAYKKSTGNVKEDLLSNLNRNAVLWIWFLVPIVFYSIAGAPNEWYIYSSYIMAAILIAVYGGDVIAKLSAGKIPAKAAGALITIGIVAVCLADGLYALSYYDQAGQGGGPAYPFRADMRALKEEYGDTYRGANIYMQDVSRYNKKNEADYLFFDLAAYAMYEYDLVFQPGGIEAWMQDEDGIFVLNKNLWDKYSGQLTGYVVLHDDGYLYFSHDRY